MSTATEANGLREPYRVSVWGPGTVGLAAIRELILLPETELRSVLAHSDDKAGADAGECPEYATSSQAG